jgi:hypothetical protein
MAEWLCSGLQSRVHRFDSGSRLQNIQVLRPASAGFLLPAFRDATRISTVDYGWAEKWVGEMKRLQALAPSKIRHHVVALARCLNWLARRHADSFPGNPATR